MARNEPQINLRIAPELKASLVTAAVQTNRSLTSEITARLRSSFEPTESERINALEVELATAHAATATAGAKAAQYQAAVMFLAGRVPAEVFSKTPGIAATMKQAGTNKRAQLVATVNQMIEDNLRTIGDLGKQIERKPAK